MKTYTNIGSPKTVTFEQMCGSSKFRRKTLIITKGKILIYGKTAFNSLSGDRIIENPRYAKPNLTLEDKNLTLNAERWEQ